jgi:hypothetical protein
MQIVKTLYRLETPAKRTCGLPRTCVVSLLCGSCVPKRFKNETWVPETGSMVSEENRPQQMVVTAEEYAVVKNRQKWGVDPWFKAIPISNRIPESTCGKTSHGKAIGVPNQSCREEGVEVTEDELRQHFIEALLRICVNTYKASRACRLCMHCPWL